MTQHTDEQLEMMKRVEAKLHALYDDMAEDEQAVFGQAVRRLVGGEESDTQGYRWREEKVERPPYVDPWDGKPWPWGLGVPPVPTVPNP